MMAEDTKVAGTPEQPDAASVTAERLKQLEAENVALKAAVEPFKNFTFTGKGGRSVSLGDVTTEEGRKKLTGGLGKGSEYEPNRAEINRLSKENAELKSRAEKGNVAAANADRPEVSIPTEDEVLAKHPELKQRIEDGDPEAAKELLKHQREAFQSVLSEQRVNRTQGAAQPEPTEEPPDLNELVTRQVEKVLTLTQVENDPTAKKLASVVGKALGGDTEFGFGHLRDSYSEQREIEPDLTYSDFLQRLAKQNGLTGEAPPVKPAEEKQPGEPTADLKPKAPVTPGGGQPAGGAESDVWDKKRFDEELRKLRTGETDAPGPEMFSPNSDQTKRNLGMK